MASRLFGWLRATDAEFFGAKFSERVLVPSQLDSGVLPRSFNAVMPSPKVEVRHSASSQAAAL